MAALVSRIIDLTAAVRDKINLMVPRLLPAGGTSGQVLAKNSATNYDAGWVTSSGSVTPIPSLPAISYLTGSELVQTNLSSTDYKTSISDIHAGAYVRLNADYTMANTTAVQQLFNHTANGALTLGDGTYMFETMFRLTGMSSTTGNGVFSIVGAGTAVSARVFMMAIGRDSTSFGSNTDSSTWAYNNQSFTTSVVSTGTAAGLLVRISGTFAITTAGTIIPSFALANASAAVVNANSYFQVKRIGASGTQYTGNWS